MFDSRARPTRSRLLLLIVLIMGQWLLPAMDLDLEAGAAFALQAPPQPGWDGVVRCRFVEIDAPRRLSYTWIVGDIDTVVTFTLTPTEVGTRLFLVQSGFRTDQKRNVAGARYGWKMMGGKLVDVLARIA